MKKDQKGFSLLEIMMMLAIIVIFIMMLLPLFNKPFKLAKLASKRSWVKSVITSIEAYYSDHGEYPMDITDLTDPDPPYIKPSVAAICVKVDMDGSLTKAHGCSLNDPSPGNNFLYLVYYQEVDGSTYFAYEEGRLKNIWGTLDCGIMPAGSVYFHEIVDGEVIRSTCRQ